MLFFIMIKPMFRIFWHTGGNEAGRSLSGTDGSEKSGNCRIADRGWRDPDVEDQSVWASGILYRNIDDNGYCERLMLFI